MATPRYICHIYSFYDGYSWTLRDKGNFKNVVLPNHLTDKNTLKECKRRSMLAFILWMAVRLIRNTDDTTKIGSEFYSV